MRRSVHDKNRQNRSAEAGLLVATGSVPNTFQRTLMPRNTVDQGMVTGITMATNYTIAGSITKFIEDVADSLAGTKHAKDKNYKAHVRQRRFSMGLYALAAGGGMLLRRKLAQEDDETKTKALVRTAGDWLSIAGTAGLVVGGLQEVVEAVKKPVDKDGDRVVTGAPVGVVGGAIIAGIVEKHRRNSEKNLVLGDVPIKPVEAVAIGVGILAVLGVVSHGQRKFADLLSGKMNDYMPGSEDFWWTAGHILAVGGTVAALAAFVRRTYHKIEEVATKVEPAYIDPPASALSSGSLESYVDWETLSVQGRRFVSGAVTKDQINTIMRQPALKEPIRLFVGLDSAKTEADRLQLALDELERTGAYDRKLLMLISPTGTGYVNYVAVEAAEIMSRGDMASIALQYSKRPSPMSLDRVPEGRLQFRMLIKGVQQRLATMPANKRPKVVLFGESLGAWTSQDAFIAQGTDGLQYAGVDKALWIGTPYGSKWKEQVLGPYRPDVEKSLVGKFDNFGQLTTMKKADRTKLKYVMITHDNDPVALFGAKLLYQKPDWLTDPAKRPPTVSHSQYYTTPGTFLLTLVDMKNAMNVIPGQFEASGHDYRADLAEFVNEVYEFEATAAQVRRVEAALRQNELARAALLNSAKDFAKQTSKKK